MNGPILVLGGSGFLGSRLVTALVETGHEVRVLDHAPPHDAAFPDGVLFHKADWRDQETLHAALEGVRTVVHLIWNTVPGSSAADPLQDMQHNVGGSLRLFEACVTAGVQRVVFSSTGGAIYGQPRRLPITEDHLTDPWSPYGIAKLAVEKYLAFYHRTRGLAYTIVRAANAYGPGQRPGMGQGVIATFIDQVQRGEMIEVWGDPDITRDYVFVDDLIAAFATLSLHENLPHTIYNVGSGQGTSLRDLIQMLEKLHGPPIEARIMPPRGIDPPANVLDTTRLREATGWQPHVSLSEGIRQAWAWLGEYHDR